MKKQYPALAGPSITGSRQPQRLWTVLVLVLTCLAYPVLVFSADQGDPDAALWEALGSGQHLALLRHAIAPGGGDPAGFTLGDCSSQRNLSDQGRDQARRIGAQFRANQIDVAGVFSSAWCRCLETAELLNLGPVQPLPALNSFFQNYRSREPQTRALREWLAQQDLRQPLVLVTHQVNITALTDVYPASGELVVVRRGESGELMVVGTLATD